MYTDNIIPFPPEKTKEFRQAARGKELQDCLKGEARIAQASNVTVMQCQVCQLVAPIRSAAVPYLACNCGGKMTPMTC